MGYRRLKNPRKKGSSEMMRATVYDQHVFNLFMFLRDWGEKRIRWKLTADEGNDCMGDGLEEEEPVVHVDLDQHDRTGGNDIEEDDDVERADSIEDHIPWTSQRLLEVRHHDSFG
jgi:hypothetical protein